jgi:hypothetical protein
MTVNDVYRKIKEMSAEAWTPRPVLSVINLSSRLETNSERLLPLLSYLQEIKLIRFNEAGRTSVKLTLLGSAVNRPRN